MTRARRSSTRSAASAPAFPINYNDVDYCLKLVERGRRVVYDPDLVMYHFESSSRSTDVEDWEKDLLRAQLAADHRRRPLLEPEPAPGGAAAHLAVSLGSPPAASTPAPAAERTTGPVNYERLYSFRFRDIDQDGRIAVWKEIGPHVHGLMGKPQKVLDPAAGRGEFIGAVPAEETWAVDAVSYEEAAHKPDTKVITAMIMDAELPEKHFDGVYVSNFLEHLYDQEAIASFLEKMHGAMEKGGRIAIMGPNYRYCSDEYWDCADHYVALTHVAIEEHLYAAGFELERVIPRYLPYSFRGILPPSPQLTRMYLKTPAAWRLLGKQFLVIGRA